MMIDLDLVKSLIEKKDTNGNYVFTGYEIEKKTGFSRAAMSKLRMGEKDLNSITLGKLIDLFNFAQENKEQLSQ